MLFYRSNYDLNGVLYTARNTEAAMKKTAVFVTVSDNDRTLDDLVNILYRKRSGEYVNSACRGSRRRG